MLDQFKVLDPLELQLEELQADTSANAAAAEEKAAGAVIKSLARRRPVRAPLPAHLLPAHLLPAHLLPAPPSAARAGRDAGSMRVPRLRRQAGEARRGHRRDTGNHPALREGGPDGAGEIHLPVLRENHSAPAADRIHGDDATVPVLAKNKAVTGRLWTPAFARAGSMSEMTGPLAAAIRRPPCFSIRAAAAASIRAGILRAGPVSCRPTPAPVLGPANGRTRGPGLANCTRRGEVRGPLPKPRAGPTAGASSLCWPI